MDTVSHGRCSDSSAHRGLAVETEDLSTSFALRFEVRGNGSGWSWHERLKAKQPRRPRLDVLAVRCPPEEKEAILSSDPEKSSQKITSRLSGYARAPRFLHVGADGRVYAFAF
jgi:hypothetical protein